MDQENQAALKLAPDMAAFRLLVLAFVRDYYAKWQGSPSYGEIAAKLDSNRTRVRKALRSLARDGLIRLSPGTRGIALPEIQDEATRKLLALGWRWDPTGTFLCAPGVTNGALPPMPVLTYHDVVIRAGANDGEQAGSEASGGDVDQGGKAAA